MLIMLNYMAPYNGKFSNRFIYENFENFNRFSNIFFEFRYGTFGVFQAS